MALVETVAIAVGLIKVGADVINEVINALDAFAVSIIIEVNNTTDETLRVEGAHHSSGGFGHPPPPIIHPHSSVVFSSRTNSPAAGAVGNLRLVGQDFWLGMSWHNPAVGSNKFRSSENGPRAAEFKTHAIAGSGRKNARFQYVVHYSDLRRVSQRYQIDPLSLRSGLLSRGHPASSSLRAVMRPETSVRRWLAT